MRARDLLVSGRELFALALEQEIRAGPVLGHPEEVARFLQTLIGFDPVESLVALYLDSAFRLICHDTVSVGGISGVSLDVRRIVLRGLERGACGIVLAHNHPSGNPEPSKSDVAATRAMIAAAAHFEMTVHDHLIVARGKIRSVLHPTFDANWN